MQSIKNYRLCVLPSDLGGLRLRSVVFKGLDGSSLAGELFCSENGHVYEVVQFKEDLRSWFCANLVINDGSLLMITQIDPIYLLLPYLIRCKSLFRSLDDLISSDEGLQQINNAFLNSDDMAVVCDHKMVDDCPYYRYNQDKALRWLKLKINYIVESLKKLSIDVSPSVTRVSNFNSGRASTFTTLQYLKYALDLITHYVPKELVDPLRDALKLQLNESKDQAVPQQGEKRSLEEAKPIDDYFSSRTSVGKSDVTLKKAKLTKSQSNLARESRKSGIVSVTSFFKPKS